MKKFGKLTALFFVLVMCVSLAAAFAACDKTEGAAVTFVKASESEDGYATLYVADGRDLNVMVLSDPQVDYYEKYKVVGSPGNDKTYRFIEDFVSATAPDFVVINGDLAMVDMPLVSQVPYFVRYAEIFERLQIPWIFTFGNHDCDGQWDSASATADDTVGQCSKELLIERMAQYEYCLIGSDGKCADGAGNSFVNVREKSGALRYTMCLFDCVYDEAERKYTPVPTAAQVSWYRDTINALSDAEYGEDRSADSVVPSVIFNHVGIPEFKTAWDEAWNDGEPTAAYHYGTWLHGDYTGSYGDMPESEQIFSVAKELGSTKAIFMCHHHDNDFSVDYQGIRLTFGQHSGYSHSYRTTQTQNGVPIDYSVKNWKGIDFSRVDNYGDNRGGTLFTVKGDGSFEITPVYARDVLDNYMTDYYIDYDAVAQSLEDNPDYTSTVTRGEKREWKI